MTLIEDARPSRSNHASTCDRVKPMTVAPPKDEPPSPIAVIPTTVTGLTPWRVVTPIRSPTLIPWSSAFCWMTVASPERTGSRPSTITLGSKRGRESASTSPGAPNVSTTSPSTTMLPSAVNSTPAAATPSTRRTRPSTLRPIVGGSPPKVAVNSCLGLTTTSSLETESAVMSSNARRIWSVST